MLEKFIDNASEDSLTAAVFSHLLHLPSEVFWQILRSACYTTSLPQYAGETRSSIEFWPKWKAEGTNNKSYVEPDIFIRFASFDLIIESKRGDNCTQSQEQWIKEVTAYANVYGDEHVPVRMIALGGIWESHDEAVTIARPISETTSSMPVESRSEIKCPIHMCRWSGLLIECQRMQSEVGRMKYQSSQTRAHQRVLSDLIDFFARHGYVTVRWFDSFNFKPNLLSLSVDSYQKYFRDIARRFQSL